MKSISVPCDVQDVHARRGFITEMQGEMRTMTPCVAADVHLHVMGQGDVFERGIQFTFTGDDAQAFIDLWQRYITSDDPRTPLPVCTLALSVGE